MTETTLEQIKSVTPAEAAEILDVSVRTLASWRQAGTGPDYFTAGRVLRYRVSDIARWQAHRMVVKMRSRSRR